MDSGIQQLEAYNKHDESLQDVNNIGISIFSDHQSIMLFRSDFAEHR